MKIPKFKLSLFTKIILMLILILFIEIILISKGYSSYKQKHIPNALGIEKINKNKPLIIVVDITTNSLSIFQDGKLIKSYPCASGKPSTPSPIGTWKIVNKGTWGSAFGGRWMGLNVPWGTYGIHGTSRPESIGNHASAGCIRMKNEDVAELYDYVTIGTYVIIWGGPYGSFGERLRPIKPGMTGSDIYALQKILKEKGYYKGALNGIYNDSLKYAIHKYQKDNNLPISDTLTISFYNKLGIYLID